MGSVNGDRSELVVVVDVIRKKVYEKWIYEKGAFVRVKRES